MLKTFLYFRVGLAAYKLSGKTNYWWYSVSRGRNIKTITWKEFEEMIYERFFKENAKTNKVVEFMNHRPKKMTIVQYETHFN